MRSDMLRWKCSIATSVICTIVLYTYVRDASHVRAVPLIILCMRTLFLALCPALLAILCLEDPACLTWWKRWIEQCVYPSQRTRKEAEAVMDSAMDTQRREAHEKLLTAMNDCAFGRIETKQSISETFADFNRNLWSGFPDAKDGMNSGSRRQLMRNWLQRSRQNVEGAPQSAVISGTTTLSKTLYDQVDRALIDHEFFAPSVELQESASLHADNPFHHPVYAISQVPVYLQESSTKRFLRVTSNNRAELTRVPDASCLFHILKGKSHHWGFQSTVTQRFIGQNVMGKLVANAKKLSAWESFRVLESELEEEKVSGNKSSTVRPSKQVYLVLCSAYFGKGMWLAGATGKNKKQTREARSLYRSIILSRHFKAAMALRYASDLAAFETMDRQSRRSARRVLSKINKDRLTCEQKQDISAELVTIDGRESIMRDAVEKDGLHDEEKVFSADDSEHSSMDDSQKLISELQPHGAEDLQEEDEEDSLESKSECQDSFDEDELVRSLDDRLESVFVSSPSTPIPENGSGVRSSLLGHITFSSRLREVESETFLKQSMWSDVRTFDNVQCHDILSLCTGAIAPEHSNWRSDDKWGYTRHLRSFPLAERAILSAGLDSGQHSPEYWMRRITGIDQFQCLTFLKPSEQKNGFLFKTIVHTFNLPWSNCFGIQLEFRFLQCTGERRMSSLSNDTQKSSLVSDCERNLQIESRYDVFWTRDVPPDLAAFILSTTKKGVKEYVNTFYKGLQQASAVSEGLHGELASELRSFLKGVVRSFAPVKSLMGNLADLIMPHLLAAHLTESFVRAMQAKDAEYEAIQPVSVFLTLPWEQKSQSSLSTSRMLSHTWKFFESSVEAFKSVLDSPLDPMLTPKMAFELLFSNASTFGKQKASKPVQISGWMHAADDSDVVIDDWTIELTDDLIWIRKSSIPTYTETEISQFDYHRMGTYRKDPTWLEFGAKFFLPNQAFTIEVSVVVEHEEANLGAAQGEIRNTLSELKYLPYLHVAFAISKIKAKAGDPPTDPLALEGVYKALRRGLSRIWEPLAKDLNRAAAQAKAAATPLPDTFQDEEALEMASEFRTRTLLQLLQTRANRYYEETARLMKLILRECDSSGASSVMRR